MSLVDDTCDNCGGRFDPMGDPLLTKHPEIGPYAVFCATCETSVPPTQPPAAPETDVRLTFEEREAIGWGVDYGTVIAEVERIVADRVRVVEGERDALKQQVLDEWATLVGRMTAAEARAESAEAAHRALQAERDEAWRVAAQRRDEARRYYVAWQVARMRARVWRRAAGEER